MNLVNRMKYLLIVLPALVFSGCSLVLNGPEEINTAQRDVMFPVANLPLTDSVTIYWNEYRVPFIEAKSDEDLAFSIGLVHAHLRLSQMELFRRASQGRLSELAGPFTVDFDKTIRIFNFGKAVPQIIASLPDESRTWVSRYLDGINWYIEQLDERPPDLEALGIEPAPYSLEELITIWRLAAADVNWIYFFSFLMMQDNPGSRELWDKAVESGINSTPSFTIMDLEDNPGLLSWYFGKSGSNSFALSGNKTSTGSALMANDPHLGITVPNFWLLIGYQSPSYHAVGLAIPGTPFIALGRNWHIAWGGTNMRTLSTFLYELEESDVQDLPIETQEIPVRFWFNSSVERRESPWGPVISDSPLFETEKPVAISWVGHDPSDELTAFLRMNRAQSWDDFRNAFETYAVSAQNFLYADTAGNIGQVLAFKQPVRRDNSRKNLLTEKNNPVIGYNTPLDLPAAYNPARGFIASANNKPTITENELGWFYSANDRIDRLNNLLGDSTRFSIHDMKHLQNDVFTASSFSMAQLYVTKLDSQQFTAADPERTEFYNALSRWDGFYHKDSPGALAYELLNYKISEVIFTRLFEDEELLSAASRGGLAAGFIRDKVMSMSVPRFTGLASSAYQGISDTFQEYKTWGNIHEMQVNHILANLPLLGSRWQFEAYPVAGNSETLFKTASQTTGEKNRVFYGANARHISDMSDPDENYFVLLGGQDGWMVSPQSLDQLKLWRSGNYIKFPLRLESIKKDFTTVVQLLPQSD